MSSRLCCDFARLAAESCEVLGKRWDIRAVGVSPDGGDCPLTDCWPHGSRPETPQP
jgi:hypothetical protein